MTAAIARAVAVLGLFTDDMTKFQTDMLYTRILNDPTVRERCWALGSEVDPAGEETAELKYSAEDVAQIIKAMTPQERDALRERIAKA